MRSLSLVALGALVAGCSTAPPPPDMRSAKAQERLNTELAGLTPGQPQSCLPHYQSQNMIVIDGHTLLFRDSSKRVYRNDIYAGCAMLGGRYALVTRSTSTSLCRGDIAQVVDVQNNLVVGSCTLGDFVPYTRP